MIRTTRKVVALIAVCALVLNVYFSFYRPSHRDRVFAGEHVTDPQEWASDQLSHEQHNSQSEEPGKSSTDADATSASDLDRALQEIRHVLETIAGIVPGVENLDTYDRDVETDLKDFSNTEIPSLTSADLGRYLQVSEEETRILKDSHAAVMAAIPEGLASNSFQGRGIVMTGAGKQFPSVLTAIAWIREYDLKTPIEVYVSDSSEYEAKVCENLFPELNAECKVIEDIYGKDLASKLNLKHSLKPLSILASRFDDIYFMEDNSYPLTDLKDIFEWTVYEDLGMIFSGDYWPRFISPHYYDIAGVPLGDGDGKSSSVLQEDKENAVGGRSTEASQFFVRKSSHIKSLLLATYYSIYSSVYSELIVQRRPGNGDKDILPAAAAICGEKFYQNVGGPETLGPAKAEEDFAGNAMVQPSPMRDYEQFVQHRRKPPKLSFWALHADFLKGNVKHLLDREEPQADIPPLRRTRYLNSLQSVQTHLGCEDDVEKRLFEAISIAACEWSYMSEDIPHDWEDANLQRLCDVLDAHIEWLDEHQDDSYSSDASLYADLLANGQIRDLYYPPADLE